MSSSEQAEFAHGQCGPIGIRGWLVIPIVILTWSVLDPVISVVRYHQGIMIMGSKLWSSFFTPGSPLYHSGVVLWILLTLLFQIALVGLSCAALFVTILRKRYAPKFMIGVFGFSLCFSVLICYVTFVPLAHFSAELSRQIAADSEFKLVVSVVYASVWIPYFLKSIRVKNTFIRQ